MTKIGRNHPCPCGSGRKYKHCCLTAQQLGSTASAESRMKTSLMAAIDRARQAATERRPHFHELGVFLLYSDSAGDAWLLEATETDAVQLAGGGEPLSVEIDENPETIAINFSHTFAVRDKQLRLTAYSDKAQSVLERAPVQQIHAAIRRLRRRVAPEMLKQMHVSEGSGDPA